MGFQVNVTARNGNVTHAVFPSRQAAECYAKGLNATVSEVPGMTVVPTVAPLECSMVAVKCPPATAEMQAEATNEYFRALRSPSVLEPMPKRPRRRSRSAEQRELDAENAAERQAEFFAESRLMGMSLEDTFADWDYVQTRRRRRR
jgi:hypothetical protein